MIAILKLIKMTNRFVFPTLIICLWSCQSVSQDDQVVQKTETHEKTLLVDQPILNEKLYTYELGIAAQKDAASQNEIQVDIKMLYDKRFLDPHTKVVSDGHFAIVLAENSYVTLRDKPVKIPFTVEALDTVYDDPDAQHWVKLKASFKQVLDINTTSDFHVLGTVKFIIEPRQTQESMPIILIQKEGVLRAMIDQC